MTKLLIINTGGTIAMNENHSTGIVSPTSANPLKEAVGLFDYFGQVDIEDLFSLPSPHITEEHMIQLQKRILEGTKQGYDGVVITHGTDTLEETAYFLDLTLDLPIPLVITGAMRSSNEIGSDGLANLRAALIVAASPDSIGKGVLVVMNDEVHTAAYVTKTHTTNVATFQTPTFGPIGLVSKSQVLYFQSRLHQEHYKLNHVGKSVCLLKAYAGMDGSLIDAVRMSGADGLVIEALGAGNLPPQTVDAINRCLVDQLPVVFVSRAFNGVTQDVYDYEGGGKRFRQAGVIFTTGLSGQKARMKLSVLLNAGVESKDLSSYFEL